MFFKRRISVREYCTTRLDLLFSEEQTKVWLQLKQTWPDQAIIVADENQFLSHFAAAHITLLSMAVTKKYRDIEISVETDSVIESYLVEHDRPIVSLLLPLYDRALVSVVEDGVLGLALFMLDQVCSNTCREDTAQSLKSHLYASLYAIRGDFKQVKLAAGQ